MPKNVEALRNAVIKKYPKPSHQKRGIFTWCEHSNTGGCLDGIMFHYKETTLQGSDPSYNRAILKKQSSTNESVVHF